MIVNRKPLLAFFVLLTLLIGSYAVAYRQASCRLQMSDRCFRVLWATTPEARQQGLSGHPGLKDNETMVFVFDKLEVQCFWMKDMKFGLDMIWLDDQKKIVAIEQNVSPDTYPQTFCPDAQARYVVEVNAGTANKLGLGLGQTVKL
ncbi:MAG: hypothetical protein JWL85_626 [Candidatus Saccharibacteria bacterium]|nr:hypothetical protein [Candidatus Saccharibacteria bacterium]